MATDTRPKPKTVASHRLPAPSLFVGPPSRNASNLSLNTSTQPTTSSPLHSSESAQGSAQTSAQNSAPASGSGGSARRTSPTRNRPSGLSRVATNSETTPPRTTPPRAKREQVSSGGRSRDTSGASGASGSAGVDPVNGEEDEVSEQGSPPTVQSIKWRDSFRGASGGAGGMQQQQQQQPLNRTSSNTQSGQTQAQAETQARVPAQAQQQSPQRDEIRKAKQPNPSTGVGTGTRTAIGPRPSIAAIDAQWADLRSTLSDISLAAAASSAKSTGNIGDGNSNGGQGRVMVFGPQHARKLADLRSAQIELAKAWAPGLGSKSAVIQGGRSRGNSSLETGADGRTGKTKDGRGGKGGEEKEEDIGVADDEEFGRLGDGKGGGQADLSAAAARRAANEAYFAQVKEGVQAVVAKLEDVSEAMRSVEMESREIWGDGSVESGSQSRSGSGDSDGRGSVVVG